VLKRYHADTGDASGFEVYPAIDLRAGRVVRLVEGDFAQETSYSDDPVAVAVGFAAAGARWIHIVDLDAARTGERRESGLIAAIARAVGRDVRCQVGGGIRDLEDARILMEAGVRRLVVGTAALRSPAFAKRLVAEFGAAHVAVAIDVREGVARGEGWRSSGEGYDPDQALGSLATAGVTTFVVTAIDRDGRLEGPDLELLRRLIGLGRGNVVASGGVSSLDELRAVRQIGCTGAIVGKAIYEGRLDLGEAIRAMSTPDRPGRLGIPGR
jgi:phosphoribosylformimino-5-aminoimidazole carboxamide ribotide isomerase